MVTTETSYCAYWSHYGVQAGKGSKELGEDEQERAIL